MVSLQTIKSVGGMSNGFTQAAGQQRLNLNVFGAKDTGIVGMRFLPKVFCILCMVVD
jgi:hypothetical protein